MNMKCVLLSLLGILTARGHEVHPVTVFEQGTAGYDAFRIPAIVTVKGTIIAFAEGRKYGCGDFAGQHNVVMSRSTNNGLNWTDVETIMDPYDIFGEGQCPKANASSELASCEFWDPTPVYDSVTDTLFLMTTRSWNHSGLSNEESRMEAMMDCWIINSTDGGITWSNPRNISDQVWSKVWHMGTPVNGHAIQSSTGRLIMPIYVRPNAKDSQTYSAIFYSDDHGVSWAFAPNSTVGEGTSESDIVQLQRTPNALMFNHRKTAGVRYKSYSYDDGMTWQGFAPIPSLPDPGCKGGIAAWPAQKALIFVNAASTTARVNITIRISMDDGETWPHSLLVSGPGGYSDVALLTNTDDTDFACVIFEWATCTIKVACIDPHKIINSTAIH